MLGLHDLLHEHAPALCGVTLTMLALSSCGSKDTATLTLSVGDEADALTRAPAPTKLVVDSLDTSGNATNLATADLPTDSVDLGDRDPSAAIRVRANAVDASGKVLVTGTSVQLQLGALANASLPIFIARVSEFARMPSPLGDARTSPLLIGVMGRYLVAAGGQGVGGTSSQIYDIGGLTAYNSPPALPVTPVSIAAVGNSLLLLDANGGGTWFSVGDSSYQSATAPSGGAFADVAGGRTVATSDGTLYIVGATRTTGQPTPRILRVGTDGTLTFASLITARLGAAAAWASGRGLVVAGGSATGAGAEVLADAQTASSALPYPADATTGAGAAALDGSHVLLGGGLDGSGQPAKVRALDLGCLDNCAPQIWADLPMMLTAAQAFDLAADTALVCGDDASGLSHVVRVTAQAAAEIPFKVARHGARGLRVNPPAITFVGGAPQVESFTP